MGPSQQATPLTRGVTELQILSVFERLENYPLLPTVRKDGNSSLREHRRSELLAQIAALETTKSRFQQRHARIVAVVLLVSATAYGAFHQLLK